MYREWAEGQIEKQRQILYGATANHKSAVQSRIDNVQDLAGVIDITKALFEVSKVSENQYPLAWYVNSNTVSGNCPTRSTSI